MRHRLLVASAAVLALAPGAARADAPAPTQGPVVVAWWSASNRDTPAPQVVPPDVGPHDLYVAGSQAVRLPASPPVALGQVGPVALAGLLFQLPDGVRARSLTLHLAGVAPPAVSLTACRALQDFAPAYDGRWAEVPPYDCTQAGTARLGTDGTVVVDGVDALQRDGEVALVLVPGPLDRVVLAAPGTDALSVEAGPVEHAAPAPSLTPEPAPQALDAGALPAGAAPVPASLLPAPPVAAAPVAPAPALAAPRAAALPARALATVPPTRPWPTLLATLLLALLAFVPITGVRGRGDVSGPRGVGRLRSERTGTVPDLS